MDHISRDHRSWNMSRIGSKNTKPEIVVRKFLYSSGLRYRLHVKLPGKPDIVMRKRKVAVFINGCFWHGHNGCKYFRLPKTRIDYWEPKITGNIARDLKNYEALEKAGWRCMIVWECEIKRNPLERLDKLHSEILGSYESR